MDNISKILSYTLALAVAVVLFIKGCDSVEPMEKDQPEHDILKDSLEVDTTEIIITDSIN